MRQRLVLGIFLAALAACGRGAPPVNQPMPDSIGRAPATTAVATPTPSPTTTPFAYSWRIAGYGRINGADNMFKTTNADLDNKTAGNYDGDLMPADPGARPGGGGQGPAGNQVDGISCDTTMPNTYHVHAFVGVYVSGKEYALPDAIGIYHAGGDQYDKYSGWYNQEITGFCFYHVHTHDASGMVHMESATAAPITQSLFTLGELLDIWGLNVTAAQFGPYAGAVTVYTSGNSAQVPCHSTAACEVGANQYSLWTGSAASVPLYAHEAVWIEVGTGNPNAAHLPGVSFATQQ